MNKIFFSSLLTLSFMLASREGVYAAVSSGSGELTPDVEVYDVPDDFDLTDPVESEKSAEKEAPVQDVARESEPPGGGMSAVTYTPPKDVSLFKTDADPATTTSIKQTMELTYMQNAQLDSTRAQLRATDENVAQAVSGWRPSASIQFQQTHKWSLNSGNTLGGVPAGSPPGTPRPVVPRTNTHDYSSAFTLEGQQNVFAGGGTVSQTETAKERVFAGRFGLINTEQQAILAGIQSFLGVISGEAIAELRKSSENFLYRTWEQTEARYEVGEVTRTEVAAADSGYLGAKAERVTAEANVETARATYERTVGSPAGELGIAEVLADVPSSLEEVIALTKANNPTIHQASHNIEAAEYDVNTQIATLLPQIDVSANIGRSRRGGSGVLVGHDRQTTAEFLTTVSVPLYRQGNSRSKIRQAHQVVGQNKVDLVNARREAIETAVRAWEDLTSARSRVESLISQVKSQKLAVEGVSEEALVGTKNILDVLEQEQKLVDAQINLVQAEQSLVLASYQVLAATGHLTAKDLHLDVELYNPEEYYDEYSGAFFQFWKGDDYRYVRDHNEDND